MKQLIVGLALTASVAHAQTSTTSAPAATETAAAPVQTSTAAAPTDLDSKFGGLLYIESSAGMKDFQSGPEEEGFKGKKAGIETLWTVGGKYKATKQTSFELQQLAYTRSNLEGADPTVYNQGKQQLWYDVVVKANQATDLRFLGSEPLTFSARYYLPTSQVTREMMKRDGTLRGDLAIDWTLSPKVTFDYALSPRIIFQSPQSADGSDAIYRMVMAPSLSYNFNDNLGVYGAVTADLRSKEIGRGTWSAEKKQVYTPEIGGNITIGKLTINPALTSDLDLNADTHAMAVGSSDSRIFCYETTTYNLNFYATF